MEVMVFDVPMLATKMIWLMMESITPPLHWMLMKICLVVFFFAFLITVVTSNRDIHCARQNEVELSAAMPDHISWLKQSNLKYDRYFYFLLLLFLLFSLFFVLLCCVFVVMSDRKVKTEFILWYHLPVQTREMLTQGDITLVSVLSVPLHLSFPLS